MEGNFIRSKNPMDRAGVDGGRIAQRPHKGGVKLTIEDPSGDTTYEDTGFYLEVGALSSIHTIDIPVSGGTVAANLWFDLDGDGDFFEWKDGKGNNDVIESLGSDDPAFGGTVPRTITRTNHKFSGKTIQEWIDDGRGDVFTAVWVGFLSPGGGNTKTVTVEDVVVD